MYIHFYGLAQSSGPTPQSVVPGLPPVPMPNLLVPPPPIMSPPQILLVRSRVQCTAAQLVAIQNVVCPGTAITDAVVRMAIQSAHDNVFPDLPTRACRPGSHSRVRGACSSRDDSRPHSEDRRTSCRGGELAGISAGSWPRDSEALG